ncbi:MAG: ATP-dependent Clp protease ATP-binding subunit [Gemmatimonadaceae bacterium]|nr:ATP-dependent Clp protease ATP-binding subunit [Gemmatimonadaceae bacterium]
MSFSDMLRSSSDSLARFTLDLTAEARAGRLEPVRCRDTEIARVIDILLRHGKNNPALVGAAGTGKTAIAEGFAQRIASGKVPLALRDARVLALDHAGLLAGTMYRGQYEERLTAIVNAASENPNIILFIDELHNLIGQGAAMGVAMDAANMLKPALVRGEFRVIGATTDDEYQRWVLGDPALERRFQKISVTELSAEDTLAVLEARRERLERHHNVSIADEALTASVALTDRYVTDRVRPDRAIDALDEACAHAQATASYSELTESLIRERLALLREVERVGAPARAREMSEELTPDESLERMARTGLAAIERFGLELEKAFGSAPARAAAAAAPMPPAPPAAPPPPPAPARDTAPRSARLASVETELQKRLVEEGLVVRAPDIARVVAVATGRTVEWP